jgi:hypothetical protein
MFSTGSGVVPSANNGAITFQDLVRKLHRGGAWFADDIADF